MTKSTKKSKFKDKLLLILTALLILGFVIIIYLFLENRFSEEWSSFYMMSIGYLLALFYLPFTDNKLRKLSKPKLFLFQFVVGILTISVAFFIFKLKLTPMPDSTAIYVLVMIPLGAASMVFLEYCVRKWNFFKINKKTPVYKK